MIPGLGRSLGEGNSYPLQYSGLENSMDCIIVHVVTELDTAEQLSLSLASFNIFLSVIPYVFKINMYYLCKTYKLIFIVKLVSYK